MSTAAPMRYLVSARKYRPQVFGDLVGQEHVAETLRNALRLDRLAHAYLFSGPRGVGKTTAARILAKAINCEVPLDQRPDAEPCRACDSCRAFEDGRSLNIIEIDAASNNKVDDIRELRETVRVPPQGARRKVYIVDEVHMLSTSAFNALLKTLEEPPPYVLFIFATTEPHKVLPTILSRCQRFDFRRIGVEETVGHLRSIAAEEHVDADEASLMLIARKGDGALRDALSAFDQAVALEGTTLRYPSLAAALGVVDIDLYFETSAHVHGRSAAGMLALVDGLVRRGYDLMEFVAGLQEHLRNLLVARTMPDTRLIEASTELQRRYGDEAARWTEADLLRQLALVADAEPSMRASSQPRLRLELALLRLAALASAHDLNAAVRAVERLEAHVRETGGALPAPAARPAAQPPSAPRPPTEPTARPAVAEPPTAYAPEAPVAPILAPIAERPAATVAPAPTRTPPPDGSDDGPDGNVPVPPRSVPPRSVPPVPPPAPSGPPSASDAAPEGVDARVFGQPALRPRGTGPTSAAPSGDGAVAPAPTSDLDAEPALRPSIGPVVKRTWPGLAEHVSVRLAALVRQARPVALRGRALVLAVPDRFAADGLRDASAQLVALLGEQIGDASLITSLDFEVDAPASDASGTAHPDDPFAVLTVLRQESPAARRLIERFGAELAF